MEGVLPVIHILHRSRKITEEPVPMFPIVLDQDKAIDRLMRFLSIEGITGQEQAIGDAVVRALREIGIPDQAIRFDNANAKIPLPTQTGNLIITLPGTKPGPRRLFSTHLDTVPLCAGAAPIPNGRPIP